MGRANISIAITSNFNSRGIDAAIKKAEQLSVAYVHAKGQFGKSAVDLGASMGMAGARLAEMGRSIAAIGDKLTTGLTIPMGLAGAAAVTAAATIDTAWYNVRKTVDMTEEGYQRLKQSAMELSETQPVSAETILNIEALGGQLGITNGYLEDFAKVVSGLDIATNMDFQTSASSLAQFRNIVQMSEDDLDNWASTVVDLGNHTATTEADMVNLAMRFASAGHIAGMSNAEILGMSAALSGLGMRAEAGGSAISRTINDINNSVALGGEGLEKWANLVGKAPQEFADAWRAAPMDAFIDVLTHINEAGSDMGAVLEELGITQIRQSDAMRRLASSGDYVRETVERANQAWQENSALTQEVERRNESLQARWDTFCNSLVNDAARIGEPLANMGLDFLEGLRPAIQGVGDLATAFANADPTVQRFAFNLAGVALSAGPFLSVAGRLVQAVGNMGVRVGRVTQQYGVYREALESTDVAMLRNLSEQQNLSTQLGLSRNEWVRSAGGIDQWKRNVQAATTVVEENARSSTVNRAAVSAYADALGVGAESAHRFEGGVRSSLGAVQFATGAQERYRNALANGASSATEAAQIALQYADNTAESAVAANRAANEALGYGGALASEARNGTDAARAALRVADSRKVQRQATANAKDAVQNMTRAEADAALATERGQRELVRLNETAEGSTSVFGRFGDALKGALMGFGASAAIGAAIAGITWLVTQFQTAAERAENLRLATDGLRESLGKTTDATGENARAWGESLATVDSAIEKQARLGETFEQNNTAAETSIHTLDRAAETIREYGNRSDLSASEQFRLQEAVNTVNEACGSQAAVLEDGTVALQDETGAWQENKQAILDNIEARKKQIRMEAAEANYKAAYEQELETKKALRDVQLEFNDAMERYRELSSRDYITLSGDERNELRDVLEKLGPLRERLEAAREAAQAAGESTEYYDRVLSQLSESSQAAAGSLEALLSSNTDFSVAFEGAEHSLSEFAAACQTLGINFDSLNVIGPEAANNIAAAFDGTARSVVEALQGAGDQGATILENIGTNWYNSFQPATQGIIGSVAALRHMTLAELMALAADMGVRGEQATSAFMEGLDRGWSPERAAEIARQFDEAFDDGLDPEVAAQAAEAFVQALADGMSVEEALAKAQQIIDGINQTLSGANFSEGGTNAGHTFFAALNESIQQSALDSSIVYSDTGQAIGRVLADGTVVGLAEGQPAISAEGAKVPESYGQGAAGNAGAAAGAGDGIVSMLIASLFGGVGQASGIGADTGQGYGAAVEAQGTRAETAAINTLGKLLIVWLLGIESAKQAGTKTGTGFAQTLAESSQKAVTAAQAISIATGTAFGAGRSQAAAAGSSLGAAFASAVWTSGGRAIAYARSIRSSVKSIFDDMPTANIKVNVTRTVSTASRSFGGRPLQYAALPSPVPVMPVPAIGGASAAQAAVVAGRAVARAEGVRVRQSSAASTARAVRAAVTATAQSAPTVDYDAMYRVVRSGVKAAIQESGGISPVVELDGRVVSRQLASHMDYELGRLDRMRG